MKQKMKRFVAGFMTMLTVFTALFSNATTSYAAKQICFISRLLRQRLILKE